MIKSAFPKIWHLGHRNIADLFDYELEVTEKIDGSQFCVGVDENYGLYRNGNGKTEREPCDQERGQVFHPYWRTGKA